MSATLLIQTLDKLVKLHQSLYEVTKQKTEIIKVGDMDALQQIMKDEQAHIMSIQKLEETRMSISKQIAPQYVQPTVSQCLSFLSQEDAKQVSEITHQLKTIIMDLKETNTLNQALLKQSMQFVNVSLSLLKPTPKSINYGKQVGTNQTSMKQLGKQGSSLLNFKA